MQGTTNTCLLGYLQKAINSANYGFFKRSELDTKFLDCLGGIQLIDWRKWVPSNALRCQLAELREILPNYVADLLVTVCRVGNQIPLPSRRWLLQRKNMGFGNYAFINT